MSVRLDAAALDFPAAFTKLLNSRHAAAAQVEETTATLVAKVRADGDAALLHYTEKFDRVLLTPETLRVSAAAVARATASCDPETLRALALAAARIRAFHEKTAPQDMSYTDAVGVRLGMRWRPLSAVGLYVPGGLAAYPSSVLMNAIPAKVAGVQRLAMVSPTPDGEANPLVLAAALLAGVDEIYCVGGAQAIAAQAYGTETLPAVDKITGPGNAYVAAAKRLVFGDVCIDMIAGPSEILVVADAANDPDWIAWDLLSQAEHDAMAQSILITDDAGFADRVEAAVARALQTLPRQAIAAASWRDHGAVIVVAALAQAVALIDRVAPEHLELAVAAPESLAQAVHNAGAIFLGRHTPEAVGDYVAGPNHVLPTGGSARFSSGLGVIDFMKRTSMGGCDAASLAAIGSAAATLARSEGLEAHARSVTCRLVPPR